MTTSATADQFESLKIDLDRLVISPLNRREIPEDSSDLRELGASLENRQEVDLIVRPHGNCYEVLDGNRRLTAARLVGLKSLWCQVRQPCTDADALKVIIVTQLHRANLDPMAEAGLVRSLLDSGMSIEQAAAELGRPPSWVARRAKLRDLVVWWTDPKTRPQWASVGFLEVVARLPAEVQVDLAKVYAEAWREPHSIDDFEREIAEKYLHQLKRAPWKLDDLAVVAAAGACTACAKRSSCQGTLFADLGQTDGDRCLDASCWSTKLTAHLAATARAILAKNTHVIVLGTAPAGLPDGAVAVEPHQVEDCRKTDEGAIPAIDPDTGRKSWVRTKDWTSPSVLKSLGKLEAKAEDGATSPKPAGPSADQKRTAKRLDFRLGILRQEVDDADRPSLVECARLVAVFKLSGMSLLDGQGWRDVMTMPEDEVRDLLWDEFARQVTQIQPIRAKDAVEVDAIAALERLIGFDPVEQEAKALAEIPEPKSRKEG